MYREFSAKPLSFVCNDNYQQRDTVPWYFCFTNLFARYLLHFSVLLFHSEDLCCRTYADERKQPWIKPSQAKKKKEKKTSHAYFAAI